MLVAFYVDNGKQLPPINQLPSWTYWTLPVLIGLPIIVWAIPRHPLVRGNAVVRRGALSTHEHSAKKPSTCRPAPFAMNC
jgi:hypothetical protein